jgi:hypothetical protein
VAPLFRRRQRPEGFDELAERLGVPAPLPALPDAEDLAEGGVAALLDELRPTLSARGVEYVEVEDRFDDEYERYDVVVDGRSYRIYDEPSWERAWQNTFALLNDLLERAGATERAYGASEWTYWLVTPDQAEQLNAEIEQPRERLYRPDLEPEPTA